MAQYRDHGVSDELGFTPDERFHIKPRMTIAWTNYDGIVRRIVIASAAPRLAPRRA